VKSDSTLTDTRPAPFLRWAGGKRRLLPIISTLLPAGFSLTRNRYFEPFVGSAAVAMSLDLSALSDQANSRIFLSDINEELVNTYDVLKNQPGRLIGRLEKLELDTSENTYYEIREKSMRSNLARAARLIYLNRTCFNGLYRENASGKFNVPYGKLANPTVCNKPLLLSVSRWLSFVEVSQGSFETGVDGAKHGDLVYLDPPYLPLSETSSFSQYSALDFGTSDHEKLANLIRKLTTRGVRVILSNSDSAATRRIYQNCGLTLRSIRVHRNISASSASRVKVRELIGVSYVLSECADPAAAESLSTEI
jgi:DNA adenine methylase